MHFQPSIDESRVNEEEFHAAVVESTSKIFLHNLKLSRRLLEAGDLKSTLAMARLDVTFNLGILADL